MRNWVLMVLLCLCTTTSMAEMVYQTSDIPLIDNRFRVDFGIKQVTFVVSRKRFKEAVILIRPDGSKARIWNASERTRWLEGVEHDIITIDNPMPGPWQAIGEISGDNRIRILSDVKLQIDRLPVQLYSGERVRVTGALFNANKKLDESYVKNAELTITAHGYNRPQDANFKFEFAELAKFNDRGERFDEIPADGVFTTYLKLDLETGKYRFAVTVKNNVFTRASNQDVVVFPSPIKSVISPLEEGADPQLVMSFDIDELDAKSIVIEGILQTKDYDELGRFTLLGEENKEKLTHSIPRPSKHGSYRVLLTMFATTGLGREIVVRLPPQAFVIPKPLEINPELAISQAELEAAEKAAALAQAEKEAEERFNWLLWIIGSLFMIIIVAIVSLFGIKYWQRKKFEKSLDKQPQMPPEESKKEAKVAVDDNELDLNSLDDSE